MRDPAPWLKKYSHLLLFSCLFGFIMQYLFVGREAGVSVPLAVVAFYSLFFYAIKGRLGGFERWKGQTLAGWLLLAPAFLLAITYVLYANRLFHALNGWVLVLCIVVQTIVLSRNSKHPWYRASFIADLVRKSVTTPVSYIGAPFDIIRGWLPEDWKAAGSSWGKAFKVIRGLLIAVPILFVVISLLASADAIFMSWLANIPVWLGELSLAKGFWRFIVGGAVAIYAFCYLWGLLFPRRTDVSITLPAWDDLPAAENKPFTFDPITACTVLSAVSIVYILFASIQFSYLFDAAKGMLPSGVAYAEYARRGFAELVVVALLNIGLLLVGLHRIERSGQVGELTRKLLLTMLVGCTIVMLISGFSRLSLYEEAYGFTQLRLIVHAFMILLGIVLMISLVRIWVERIPLAKSYISCTILTYVLINYANIDARVAENNIERYERSGNIDLEYLGKLSADAIPVLTKFQAAHPELVSLQTTITDMQTIPYDNTWTSWNLSKYKARRS